MEHILTARAAGDLEALFAGLPELANLVELDANGAPQMGSQHQELAAGVPVGALILVKPGETVRAQLCQCSLSSSWAPVRACPALTLLSASLTRSGAVGAVQVALDGDIVYGDSLVSMQHITGENLPLRRGPGAQLPAGSENYDGLLVLRVTQAVADSTPARISRLARHAQVMPHILCGGYPWHLCSSTEHCM